MATAVNPSFSSSISIGSAVGSIADWLRQITVRVSGSGGSRGSGVVWDSEGLVVTNAHVAVEPEMELAFADGQHAVGRVVLRDRKIDLALLASPARSPSRAVIRSAKTLRPGELVIAVGNPWDGENAVSAGIVNACPRRSPFVIADIRLAPGNSGGPLADAEGNLVGISSMVIAGLGCAVTSDTVCEFVRKARAQGTL